MAEADYKPATRSRLADLIWWLVAASPAIFALLTWNPTEEARRWQNIIRTFSMPISAVEIIVIIFALCVGFKPVAAMARMPGWSRLLLGALVAIAVGTALFVAPDKGRSILRTDAWLVHLLFGFSAWHLFRTNWWDWQARAWPALVVGSLAFLFVLALLVAAVPNPADFNWKGLGLGVIHVRQLGFYSIVGAGAAIGLAAVAPSRKTYWLAIAAAALMIGMSFWSGTRGSLLAVFVAFIAGMILLPAMRRWQAAAALVVSYAAGALLSLLHQPPHNFYGIFRISRSSAFAGADEMASGRLTQWRDSAEAVLNRPFFGHGESQYGFAVPAWSEFNHPHNIILQVLIQWGIVGAACFFALAAYVGWRFILSAREGGPDMVPPFLVAGGLATMSFYEGSLYHPYPVMMLALAIAFVLSRGEAGRVR